MLTWIFTFPGCGIISYVNGQDLHGCVLKIHRNRRIYHVEKNRMQFYYDNFMRVRNLPGRRPHFLKEKLTDFDPGADGGEHGRRSTGSSTRRDEERNNQLTDVLAKAFITPIEREDIVSLSF